MDIQELISLGATFYVSHSGGKDSQAMYSLIREIVPNDQVVVVHANLGEVEWHGVIDHIRANIEHPLNIVEGVWADGSPKTLINMVENRAQKRPDAPAWPSSKNRYCTSDLKRDPIHKFIRHDMKNRGAMIGLNCTGIRAEESVGRAKKNPFDICKRLTNKSRTVYEWMPIFDWSTQDVFAYIESVNQKPFWAYAEGNERLSCVFCILGSPTDLTNGLKHRPELFEKYMKLEKLTGNTMFHTESLSDRIIPTMAVA